MEKLRVSNDSVCFEGKDYFAILLYGVEGRSVEVMPLDGLLYVFLNGCLFCVAVRAEKVSMSPVRPSVKGRDERMAPASLRHPSHYRVTDDFPALREAKRSEGAMRREILRTGRSYRRLSQSVSGIKNPVARGEMAAAVHHLCLALMDMSRLLDKEAQGGY